MKWTAQNVRLGEDEFAFGDPTVGTTEVVAARVIQVASDVLGPLDELRVLDLACLEGLYGLEFAMHGAEVVATEGRESNAERVRYAATQLKPGSFEISVEDVRELGPETHGTFDLVLCMGILYHLDAEDVFRLAMAVASCTDRMAIFRTAVGLSGERRESFGGKEYRGFTYHEPNTGWSSIENHTSFWPTRASLLNLLAEAGFTSVFEVVGPPVLAFDGAPDATFLVAMKGGAMETLVAPPEAASRYRRARWPENHRQDAHPAQQGRLARLLGKTRYWRRMTQRN